MRELGNFIRKNSNSLIIAIAIIIASIIMSSSNMFRSAKDDCYYKNYKKLVAQGAPKDGAAMVAKNRCK